MRLALCGNPNIAQQIQNLATGDVEFKFFVRDFVIDAVGGGLSLPQISFFEFRRLINYGELDGLIIAAAPVYGNFTKTVVRTCKLYNIPQVCVVNFDGDNPVYTLNTKKIFIPYIETSIIDGCNLNCRACVDFSSLFGRDEVYPLENFRRDVEQISRTCDLVIFRLMGGEPLLLKNLDDYIQIARKYLPQTHLHVVTNGLLIPSLPQKILDVLRENRCIMDISAYAPTRKIADKIQTVLATNKITFNFDTFFKDKFVVFMTLHGDNDPEKSRAACLSDICRFLRGGKLYKCQNEALRFRLAERFGVEGLPAPAGVDIYAPNFSSLLDMLDGNVEMCYWCSERAREIPWQPTNNPKLEDWLADPDELKNFF